MGPAYVWLLAIAGHWPTAFPMLLSNAVPTYFPLRPGLPAKRRRALQGIKKSPLAAKMRLNILRGLKSPHCCCHKLSFIEEISTTQNGLTVVQAQKLLAYVADRLDGVDNAVAERLFDGFVDRLRGLDDIAAVKGFIAESNDVALRHFGGVEGATNLIYI